RSDAISCRARCCGRARRRLLAVAQRSTLRAWTAGLSVAMHAVPRGGPVAKRPGRPAGQSVIARVARGENPEGKLSAGIQAQTSDEGNAAESGAGRGDPGTGGLSQVIGGPLRLPPNPLIQIGGPLRLPPNPLIHARVDTVCSAISAGGSRDR